MNYTIVATLGGKSYTENVLIPRGRKFTYVCHIYQPELVEEVTIAVFRDGEPEPISQTTYQLGG